MTHFSAEFFSQNRKKLRTLAETAAPIVVGANGVMQRNSDVTYSFRQDSSFWYLTGLSQPDITLVLESDMEYLILPERDEIIRQFDGGDDLAALKRTSGIQEILYDKEGWQELGDQLKKNKQVATLLPPPAFVERHGIYTNPARGRLLERLKTASKKLDMQDLRQTLAHMRAIKRPEELEAMQAAIDLTGEALQHVFQSRIDYRHEYEIEAEITGVFRKAGYGHAFSPIVASGKSACTIHHVANNNPVDKKGLLVLDIGAEVANYAADITRTYAISKPSERQRAVYEAVRDVQQYGIDSLKPGVFMKEFEKNIEVYMGEKLLELGLIRTNDKENVRKYYPHATSHFLGLDTHDVGDYDQPLAPGMVVTCEPGIYIPEEGIGVRIEDDILITDSGNETLSKNIPVGI